MATKKYVCCECGETFESDWPDSEAERQAEEVFGVKNAATDPAMAVVCSHCYRRMGLNP